MIPVISVKYFGSGTGVSVGVGVGSEVSTGICEGNTVSGTGLGVDLGVGVLGVDVRAAAATFADETPGIVVESSKTGAALAGKKERKVPAIKVTAIRMNNRMIGARGSRGWFIVARVYHEKFIEGNVRLAAAFQQR